MSNITNYGSTRSGTGCFIAVRMWQQWATKGQLVIIAETGLSPIGDPNYLGDDVYTLHMTTVVRQIL